ncbi:DUF4190 domain-containing protein [Actinotalea ferrariae]|uniref:DUF4190 domain-containing protein n=1 Tax=Actinotalea ferrariae TaxID=1386098 RepID=UPI001C8BD6CA|nr:DUF4190 domain-containing protein [Actinotalea ferrariae]MBX9245003.1 DUF4190 domain-containing protein [Actinotalea ferrariae]
MTSPSPWEQPAPSPYAAPVQDLGAPAVQQAWTQPAPTPVPQQWGQPAQQPVQQWGQPGQQWGQQPSQQWAQQPAQQWAQQPAQQWAQQPAQQWAQQPAQQWGPSVPHAPVIPWQAGPPAHRPQSSGTERKAVWSLVAGVFSMLGAIFLAVVAIWMGVEALRLTRVNGSGGRALAIAGIVTGSIGVLAFASVIMSRITAGM